MSDDAAMYLAGLGSRNRSWRANFVAESLENINVSFSNAGEDLFLLKKLKYKLASKDIGTYVDIGAFHPFFLSNTYLYYSAGWSGVCVDANPIFKSPFAVARPRDVFVSAAVMEDPRDILFARHKTNTGMSSIFEDESLITTDYDAPITVPAMRLDNILDEHLEAGRSIDFMSVDTEKTELSVLRSNNWDRYRPKLLCIELHTVTLDTLSSAPLVSYLEEVGYAAYAYSPPNVFFQDATLSDL